MAETVSAPRESPSIPDAHAIAGGGPTGTPETAPTAPARAPRSGATPTGSAPAPIASTSIGRSVRLFRAARREPVDPAGFYSLLAADSVHQLSRFTTLAGSLVLDVGGGPGYFRSAFQQAGAHYVWVEPDISELSAGGIVEPGRVLGSALDMPFATASVDICYSSNVLEHVPDPWRMCEEMVRVTRPGGVIFLSFTNWLSPWGGHETAPWHYLGGHRAARRYERRTGTPPKNRYGSSLFAVSVADALAWAHGHHGIDVVAAMPRYLPAWTRPILRVPGVREVVTWNLAMVFRRR
ncbi:MULTISPECIES: class I SAM-dependent methyltransferase [Protofrankia]|uniref:class I SAM-dependent methyltransferase n=1 Tax=Protofrankia TaxID=2994361 RepID=UPI001F1C5259|nr:MULTISPECIES: class I SAM-dependent methyltransferase [Protofrankia]